MKFLIKRKKLDLYRYSCPELENKEKTELVYHVSGLDDLEKAFSPYVSRGLINGKEMKILRDSGTNIDVTSAHDVTMNQFTGEKLWVNQVLDNELYCLYIVEVELNLSTGDAIRTKAAAVIK